MKKFSMILFAVILSASSLLTGCRSPDMPLTPAQQGAVAGGLGGGTIGAVWANNAHDGNVFNSWQGAGAGVVAGVAAGALIGDALDEYAGDNAATDRDKDELINELQQQLSAAEQELELLRNQPGMENVQVESVDGQLRFTILNEVLFSPGKTALKPASMTALDSVLTVIQQEFPNRDILIEGHADSDPIRKSQWKDNWELSYNRSMAVLYYYMNDRQMPSERLKAVACGAYHPVVPNDSEANKRMNRRAVIVVMPENESLVVDRKS